MVGLIESDSSNPTLQDTICSSFLPSVWLSFCPIFIISLFIRLWEVSTENPLGGFSEKKNC